MQGQGTQGRPLQRYQMQTLSQDGSTNSCRDMNSFPCRPNCFQPNTYFNQRPNYNINNNQNRNEDPNFNQNPNPGQNFEVICYSCNTLGHTSRNCNKKININQQLPQQPQQQQLQKKELN